MRTLTWFIECLSLTPRAKFWPLLQALPATALGQRVVADARNVCAGRKESTEELDKVLHDLQVLVTKDTLSEKTLGQIRS